MMLAHTWFFIRGGRCAAWDKDAEMPSCPCVRVSDESVSVGMLRSQKSADKAVGIRQGKQQSLVCEREGSVLQMRRARSCLLVPMNQLVMIAGWHSNLLGKPGN